MQISLQHIHKSFGPTPVLADISLEVQREELFFLLGPSGCGKTTLLRLIAGFYQPDRGEIHFDGRRMNDIPPHRRNTGMVFQNYALWPHLTVAENVSYGLAVRGLTRREQETRVQQALETVQLRALGQRTPNALSGGQQQRVALARALVIQPDVLLLDEPLSNLDAKLRLEMRDEIRRIHAQTRITTIYVTHDQKESLSLATRIAVMRDGRIDQIGAPRTIYRQPQTRFVAEFIGETNWFSGKIAASDSTSAHVETSSGPVHLQTSAGLPPGTKVWLGFRPESVQLDLKGNAAGNVFPATIESVTYLGEIEQYSLRLANGTLIRTVESNPVTLRNPGEALEVTVRPENFFMIQADGV